MRFEVLGPLRVYDDTGNAVPIRSGARTLVLALLLAAAGRRVGMQELTSALWPIKPPRSAEQSVRSHVSHLRRTLGPDIIRGRHAGYLLPLQPHELDAQEFTALVELAGRTRSAARHHLAADLYGQALSLWRGAPYGFYPSDVTCPALLRHIQELTDLWTHATTGWADTSTAAGRAATVVADLLAQFDHQPDHPELTAALMRALHASGQQDAALDTYTRHRLAVAERGARPNEELQALQTAVLRNEPGPRAGPEPARTVVEPGTCPPAAPSGLPPQDAGFIGREYEMAQMYAALETAGQCTAAAAITAITGTGGMGKTSLAVHWAHQVGHRFPDGILYQDLCGFDPSAAPVPPSQALADLLDSLGVPPDDIPADPQTRAAYYRTVLKGQRILVILDNAADSEQVRPLLPGSPGSYTIVTSRTMLTGLITREGADLLALEPLTDDEACRVLQHHLGRDRVDNEPQAAKEIVAASGRLPLALKLVALQATTGSDSPLQTLSDRLKDTSTRLDAIQGAHAGPGIGTVFACSYHQLGTDAQRLFRLYGLSAGPEISLPAAARLIDRGAEQTTTLLRELSHASLFTETMPDRYRAHDLLRDYARDLAQSLDPTAERAAGLRRLLDHYAHAACHAEGYVYPQRSPLAIPQPFPDPVTRQGVYSYGSAMTWFTTEMSSLLASVAQAHHAGLHRHTWQLAWALNTFLHRRGHWQERITMWEITFASAQVLGDRQILAHTHRFLADTCLRVGTPELAEEHLTRALELHVANGDKPGQAHTHRLLNRLAEQDNDDAQALRHATAALRLFEFLEDTNQQAVMLAAIGRHCTRLGDYEEAIHQYQQAIELHSAANDRHAQAGAWRALGYAHHRLGHTTLARDTYQRSLEAFQGMNNSYEQALTLLYFGDLYNDIGESGTARDHWMRSLELLEELGHPIARRAQARLHGTTEPHTYEEI